VRAVRSILSRCIMRVSIKVLYLSYNLMIFWLYLFFFFFQAEDGIRDATVTGVQTCALPILGIRTHPPQQDPAIFSRGNRRARASRLGRRKADAAQHDPDRACGLAHDEQDLTRRLRLTTLREVGRGSGREGKHGAGGGGSDER